MTSILILCLGIALLIGGLLLMRYGLNRLLWHRLQSLLAAAAATPIRGLLAGAIAAMLFQSSTAVCLVTIGLVTAEYLSFRQALGIILGANIGTCSTVGMLGFLRLENILPIIGANALLCCLSKRSRDLGLALAGLSGLFGGLLLLNHSLTLLQQLPAAHELIRQAGASPWHGILAGVIITFMFQSSSAATAMVMSLTATGIFNLTTAAYIIYGNNLGSCLSSVLVSTVAPVAAKRVAAAHILLNLLGIIAFLPLTERLVALHTAWLPTPSAQVAMLHTVFNIVSSIAVLPIINKFSRLVELLVPQR